MLYQLSYTPRGRHAPCQIFSTPKRRKRKLFASGARARARISVQFSILPLPDPAGGLRGIAAVLRDVTDDFALRKRLRRELEACWRASAV